MTDIMGSFTSLLQMIIFKSIAGVLSLFVSFSALEERGVSTNIETDLRKMITDKCVVYDIEEVAFDVYNGDNPTDRIEGLYLKNPGEVTAKDNGKTMIGNSNKDFIYRVNFKNDTPEFEPSGAYGGNVYKSNNVDWTKDYVWDDEEKDFVKYYKVKVDENGQIDEENGILKNVVEKTITNDDGDSITKYVEITPNKMMYYYMDTVHVKIKDVLCLNDAEKPKAIPYDILGERLGIKTIIDSIEPKLGITLEKYDGAAKTAEANATTLGGTYVEGSIPGTGRWATGGRGLASGTSPVKYPWGENIGDNVVSFEAAGDLNGERKSVVIEDPLGLYDGVYVDVKTMDGGVSTNYDDLSEIERSYNVNLDFYKLEKVTVNHNVFKKIVAAGEDMGWMKPGRSDASVGNMMKAAPFLMWIMPKLVHETLYEDRLSKLFDEYIDMTSDGQTDSKESIEFVKNALEALKAMVSDLKNSKSSVIKFNDDEVLVMKTDRTIDPDECFSSLADHLEEIFEEEKTILAKGDNMTEDDNEKLAELGNKARLDAILHLGPILGNVKIYKGTKLSNVDGYVRLLLEVPSGWDDNEVQAVRINDDEDTDYVEALEYRLYDVDGDFVKVVDANYAPQAGESVKKFIAVWTNHFSNYALVDPNGDGSATTATGALRTGDGIFSAEMLGFYSAVLLLGVYLVIQKRKKFNI